MKQKNMSAKYEDSRPNIPADVRRQVLMETGYQCAIAHCTEHTYLEIHHINQNREDNRSENLIVLCDKHHKMAHAGVIDKKALQDYKKLNREKLGLIHYHEIIGNFVTKKDLEQVDKRLTDILAVVQKNRKQHPEYFQSKSSDLYQIPSLTNQWAESVTDFLDSIGSKLVDIYVSRIIQEVEGHKGYGYDWDQYTSFTIETYLILISPLVIHNPFMSQKIALECAKSLVEMFDTLAAVSVMDIHPEYVEQISQLKEALFQNKPSLLSEGASLEQQREFVKEMQRVHKEFRKNLDKIKLFFRNAINLLYNKAITRLFELYTQCDSDVKKSLLFVIVSYPHRLIWVSDSDGFKIKTIVDGYPIDFAFYKDEIKLAIILEDRPEDQTLQEKKDALTQRGWNTLYLQKNELVQDLSACASKIYKTFDEFEIC